MKYDKVNEALDHFNEIKDTYDFLPFVPPIKKGWTKMTIQDLKTIREACDEAILALTELEDSK